MEHGLELIQSYPGNRWKFDFYNFLISWKYWKSSFFWLLISWKYWKLDFSNFLISWKYWKYDFSWFLGFLQKRRAPKFHAEWSGFRSEISHLRPIQGQKLKLFQTPISRWHRRRRRRADNSPIWPDPWTITPRDQISVRESLTSMICHDICI